MTKDQLADKHLIQWRAALPSADVFQDMARISIEYAISVLEDYRESIIQYMIGSSDRDGVIITPDNAREVWGKTKWDLGLQAKITELQLLIK